MEVDWNSSTILSTSAPSRENSNFGKYFEYFDSSNKLWIYFKFSALTCFGQENQNITYHLQRLSIWFWKEGEGEIQLLVFGSPEQRDWIHLAGIFLCLTSYKLFQVTFILHLENEAFADMARITIFLSKVTGDSKDSNRSLLGRFVGI